MKKKSFFRTICLAGAFGSVFAGTVFGAPVTEEQARSIALDHAGVETEQVAFIQTEQELEDGQTVINVEFVTTAYEEYDYQILAGDGKILGADYEKKGTLGQGKDERITLEQAKEAVLKHAGLEADQETFLKEKLDLDDKRQRWKVEFYTEDFQKFDYEVDGETWEIVEWDYDADSRYARQDAALKAGRTPIAGSKPSGSASKSAGREDGAISLADAKAVALKMASLQDSQVTWGRVHKEYDDGRQIYKGEFYFQDMEYEFEVDALTGELVDWEVESIYD